jgi:D-alanyl-D-alanine carboxypeptidase
MARPMGTLLRGIQSGRRKLKWTHTGAIKEKVSVLAVKRWAVAPASKKGLCIKALLLLLAFLSLLASACGDHGSGPAADPAADPGPGASLQAMVESEWNDYKAGSGIGAGGLALYIVTPQGSYSASSDLGDASIPGLHFRAASNTKTFTAAGIMFLYQQGLLNIDDTITSLIPGKAIPYVPATSDYDIPYKNSITIRQLLSHTAGVFDNTNEIVPATCPVPYAGKYYELYIMEDLGQADHTFSFDEMVGVNATCGLSHSAPGGSYSYSNIGYDLLGKIIERVSGLSYVDFIAQNLVIPNGLSQTTLPYLGNDKDLPSPYAEGYRMLDGGFAVCTRDNISGQVAEGNVISTPADLTRWLKLLITGNSGVTKQYADMMGACSQSGNDCYGLGVFHMKGLGYGHNGYHRGYLSLMLYNPDDDVAVLVFSTIINDNDTASEMTLHKRVVSRARQILGFGGAPEF